MAGSQALDSVARRRTPRCQIGVLVELGHGMGWTRDVSASGVYFETEESITPGAPIRISLLLEQTAAGPMRLECEGRIVRVEEQDGRLGVAAAFTVSRLVPGEGGERQGMRRFRLAGAPPG